MTDMKKSDMLYKDYSWTAVTGDDPTKTEADRKRFSRKEGYEVLDLINGLKHANGRSYSLDNKKIVEWMLREKLPSSTQNRDNVITWVGNNFDTLKDDYPFED
ncbi:hypothetical protein LES60_07030 [Pectobacterium brasiliense]|uniref:hypothetical protein n=1 Tax=Pectobacterium TaxID=122277 RepID=UPI001CE1B6FC|nr:hypothetical protein [Pectobacterium brasiliense]MCA5919208.1 hypothetical protein [Pectobacterium brasiliense]MCA5926405.1 hypothetical protein [Pectobacterium brasiliense]MCA5935579.1 hypothetical protein [Pectobacterium brasiliense]MCA5941510.1 hypothetical protein [Pectobacterium brasiliense]MCA5943192.1 hypothetical protein [Pectobacterium brasiliense]